MEPTAFERGLSAWKQGQWLTAHDSFEAAFHVSQGRLRTLYGALAQLTAGLYQLSLGRGRAAASTLGKASKKLASIDALTPHFAAQLADFCERTAIHPHGARFVEVSTLPSWRTWPIPDAEQIEALERALR